MRKLLLLILFISCSVLCAMGDEGDMSFKSFEIKMLVGIDDAWLNFSYNVNIPEDAPQLEEFCCSYLSGDHQFKTIDEYCLFQLNSYKKKKEWERALCPGHDLLRIVPVSKPVVDRFQTFHISANYEYHTNVRKEHAFIYDMQEQKVLSLEDIFIPEMIETINKDCNGKPTSVALTANSILYGTDPTGNNMKNVHYTEIGNKLTESFKQAINYEKFVAKYQKQKEERARLLAERKLQEEDAKRIKQEKERKEIQREITAYRERLAHMTNKHLRNAPGKMIDKDDNHYIIIDEILPMASVYNFEKKEEGHDKMVDVDGKQYMVSEMIVDEIPLATTEVMVSDIVEQMPMFGTYTYVVIIRDPNNPERSLTKTITESGDKALIAYLNNNVHYPVIAERNGIQGRVVTTFVVERDGSITDVLVIKSANPSLDKEAVRVVKSMPRWNPGKHKGVPVRVKFTLPVTFRLQ